MQSFEQQELLKTSKKAVVFWNEITKKVVAMNSKGEIIGEADEDNVPNLLRIVKKGLKTNSQGILYLIEELLK